MARFDLSLAVVLVGVILVQTGECLQCYQCASSLTGACADVANKPEFIKQCQTHEDVCYFRAVFPADPTQGEIARGCGTKDVCNRRQDAADDLGLCGTCIFDLCNYNH